MFCTDCGEKNLTESKFCKRCGHRLEAVKGETSLQTHEEAYIRALPDDERVKALLERAYTLKAAGNLTGAISTLNEAVSIQPDSGSAHSLLGQLYALQGDTPGAIRAYEAALAINPGDIADRMKLDELKRDDLPSPPLSSPQALYSPTPSSTANSRSRSRLAPVLIGLGAFCLGGIAVALFRNSGSKPASPNIPPSVSTTVPFSGADNRSPASSTQSTLAQPVQSASTFPSLGASLFPDVSTPPRFSSETSPRSTEAGQERSRVSSSSSPPPPSSAGSRTNRVMRIQPPRVNTDLRVRENLDGGDNVVGTGSDAMKIEIDAGQRGSSSAAEPRTPTNHLDVSMGEGDSGSHPALASNNARSARLIGDDLKLKGDYTRAIPQYQKALPGSGDGAAYLFQQIGECYRRKGDKTSARSNYERAAGEYRRLISTGKQTETAKDGLRLVETSLKLCQ